MDSFDFSPVYFSRASFTMFVTIVLFALDVLTAEVLGAMLKLADYVAR